MNLEEKWEIDNVSISSVIGALSHNVAVYIYLKSVSLNDATMTQKIAILAVTSLRQRHSCPRVVNRSSWPVALCQ